MLKRETVIISLGNDALRVGVCSGGEVVRSDRRFISIDGIDALWRAGLRPLDDALRPLLRDLKVRPGTPAMVVFHSPNTFADIFAAPSTGNAARAAAMLNLRQTLAPTPGGWQMRAVPLRQVLPTLRGVKAAASTTVPAEGAAAEQLGLNETDKAGTGKAGTGRNDISVNEASKGDATKPVLQAEVKPDSGAYATGKASTLMLTIAESNDHCDLIARAMERVGLRVHAVLPARAALLAKSMQANDSASNAPVVRVHVCEQTMTLLGWANGQLLFARCTDAGYGLLTDALYRSAKSAGASDEFTREAAARALFTVGIPTPGQVLDVAQGIRGEHALPLMQPALQRCLVEIRQTLRFGMAEADLDRSTVIIDGPGASIPGFIDTMSEQLDRPLVAASAATATAVAEDMVGDLPIAAAMLSATELWLIPACERVRRDDARFGVAMRAGAGVAIAALVLWAGQAYSAARDAKQKLAMLQPRVTEIAQAEKVQRDYTTVAGNASQVRTLLQTGLGDYPEWVDVLAMLADHKLPGVALSELSYEPSGDGKPAPTLTVRGRAEQQQQAAGQPETARSRDGVVLLLQYLDKSPLVLGTRIVTNRIEAGSKGTREFTIAIELNALKPIPPEIAEAEALSDGDGLASQLSDPASRAEDASVDAPSPVESPAPGENP